MPCFSTSFRFSFASPVVTTTGIARAASPSMGNVANSAAILVQNPHFGLKKMSSTSLPRNSESLRRLPAQVRQLKVGSGPAQRQSFRCTSGLLLLCTGVAPELFFNVLQSQQDAAVLADELLSQPATEANQ
jgi:hypothetical protein